ncbi:ABC transporter ATP-binding protein [Streptomyces boninensis]|uniref:ABC transporter ATP-binding protein n=1 Tax=Streptomyces boninensis TaxID=2039455 RepID=UPI003B217569
MLREADPPDGDLLGGRGLHYSHGPTPALVGVSVGAAAKEIVAITGPRGSGKTTLLRCLSGQLTPDEGEVRYDDGDVYALPAARRERLRLEYFGWIDPKPELVPELSVWENAALPLLLTGAPHRECKRRASEWLDRLDAGDLVRARPRSLTTAQAQRVCIARALVMEPAVLFADEPTAALHRAEGVRVLRTLVAAARSHAITTVLASHDAEAQELADRTVTLLDGRRTGTGVPTPAESAEGSTDGGSTETEDSCSLSV